MGRIANSMRLMQSSLTVIGNNKSLLLFPALTGVMTLGIILFFLTPVALKPTGHSYKEAAHWKAVAGTVFTQESLNEASSAPKGTKVQLSLTTEAGVQLAIFYFVCMFAA